MSLSLCGQIGAGANTGVIDCDYERGNPVMMLPGGATFPPANYADQATLDAVIRGKFKLPTGDSQKLYPFPVIQGVTSRTEAAKYGALGYGLSFKLVRSKPGYEFDVLAGSSLEKQLIQFDGLSIPLLILDDKGYFAGVLDASNNFKGAVYQVGVEPREYGDAANPKSTKITISIIDAADYVENLIVFKTALKTSQLQGLKTVNLTKLSNVTNVWKVKMKIPTVMLGGDLDIYDDYAALIAALTFTAKSGASYATNLPVTSVAVDAALKALTVTFDSATYSALTASTPIRLDPPTPAVLDAANVTGVELMPLYGVKS